MAICAACSEPLAQHVGRGRPRKYCSTRCSWQAREKTPDRIAYYRSSQRRAADNARARARYQDPARRVTKIEAAKDRARRLAADRVAEMALAGLLSAPPEVHVCVKCGGGFRHKDSRARYCSDACRPPGKSAARAATNARGYGWTHQKIRRELLPLAYGTPCALCGVVMVEGDNLDLDHSVPLALGGTRGDRILHASCNRRAGAVMGNRMRGAA